MLKINHEDSKAIILFCYAVDSVETRVSSKDFPVQSQQYRY